MRQTCSLARLQLQDPAQDLEVGVPRNDIDMVGENPLIGFDLRHGQGGRTRKDIGQRAGMVRIEMLNQHESHARIRRQMPEQLGERFQSSGGGADSDDRKAIMMVVGAGTCLRLFPPLPLLWSVLHG